MQNSTTHKAHKFLAEVITKDDIVVDATMGNGYDTAFLARLCKNVFAFDVQEEAVEATQERLDKSGLQATLIRDGHQNIDKYISAHVIKAAIFNLGYLPGSDKKVITQADTTVEALGKICGLLVHGGRIAVTVYPGHAGGKAESDAVLGFVKTLPAKKWRVEIKESEWKTDESPYVVLIELLLSV